MSFFITSVGSGKGADLGGLAGADRHCQSLAQAVGAGHRTWRAYLSTSAVGGSPAVNARDRIGRGPWQNANGTVIARDVNDLHGNNNLTKQTAVNEKGGVVNGRGDKPNMHDILTGSTAEGTLMEGQTCADWTSASSDGRRRVGHSDGFGGGGSTAATPTNNVISWNSAHTSAGCANTAPGGGAGRFYCFAQ